MRYKKELHELPDTEIVTGCIVLLLCHRLGYYMNCRTQKL